MEEITIPLPDFTFSDVIRRKAQEFGDSYLHVSKIVSNTSKPYEKELDLKVIKKEVNGFATKSDKLIFISEMLNYLVGLELPSYLFSNDFFDSSEEDIDKDREKTKRYIEELQFDLYQQLNKIGYSVDKNTFSVGDISEMERKINAILIKLDKLDVGQEILFDDINEFKSDLADLKTDYISGKKKWYQRFAGIVTSYAGKKGADLAFEKIKPEIIEVLHNQGVIKLLNKAL